MIAANKAIAALALTETNATNHLSNEQVVALIYRAATNNDNETLTALIDIYKQNYPASLNDTVAILAYNNKPLSMLNLIEKFNVDINIAAYTAAFNGCHDILHRLTISKHTAQTPINMDNVARGFIDGGNGTAAEKLVRDGCVSAQVVVEAYHKDGYHTRALALEDAAETARAISELQHLQGKINKQDLSAQSNEKQKRAHDTLTRLGGKYQFEQEGILQPTEYMKLVDFSQTYSNITVSSIGMFSSSGALKNDLKKVGEDHSKEFGFK
tara:strand:+ start:505 stop:1311 length:807 start_codon:yes stop_codon:yes gene_type:complete